MTDGWVPKPGDRVRFVASETTKPWIAERDGGKVGIVRFVEADGMVSVRMPDDSDFTGLFVHMDRLRPVGEEEEG